MATKDTKTAEATTTAVATTEAAGLPAVVNFEEDANLGYEGADSKCYAVPLIYILQDLSKAVKKKSAEYIEGAEPGMMLNNVTSELFSGEKGFLCVQAFFKHSFNLWVPRDAGGGFRGELNVSEGEALLKKCVRNDKNQDIVADTDGPYDGLQLVDTRSHYLVILHEDGRLEPVCLPLTSTQVSESKKWMTLSQQLTQGKKPLFSQIWQITTGDKTKGDNTWSVVKIKHHCEVNADTLSAYVNAKQFYSMIISGMTADANEGDIPF